LKTHNMLRKTSLLIFTLFMLTLGCKKTNSVPDNSVHGERALPGVWELRSVYGGNSVAGGGNYLPGNGYKWKFTGTAYWLYVNNTVADSGLYKLSSGVNPQTSLETNAMILNDTPFSLYYEIANDTLTIYRGVVAADGTIEKYVRIENP